MKFIENDGGRKAAGYKGNTGDCVTRAIAIAAQVPYKEVYDELYERGTVFAKSSRSATAARIRKYGASPRNGVHREIYDSYLSDLGWKWYPTMQIGQGCKVHLKADELPSGRIICRVSKHIVAVIDGAVHDTYNPTRGGTRCVYGYWTKN